MDVIAPGQLLYNIRAGGACGSPPAWMCVEEFSVLNSTGHRSVDQFDIVEVEERAFAAFEEVAVAACGGYKNDVCDVEVAVHLGKVNGDFDEAAAFGVGGEDVLAVCHHVGAVLIEELAGLRRRQL